MRGHWTIENRTHWVRDVTFDEVTSEYRHLVRLARCRLGLVTPASEKETLHNFVFFDRLWLLVTLVASLLVSIGFVAAGFVSATYGTTISDKEVFTPVTAVLFALVPMWLLLGSAVTLWRVAVHQHRVGKLYPRGRRSMPAWLVVLGALLLSLATVLWLVALFNAHR